MRYDSYDKTIIKALKKYGRSRPLLSPLSWDIFIAIAIGLLVVHHYPLRNGLLTIYIAIVAIGIILIHQLNTMKKINYLFLKEIKDWTTNISRSIDPLVNIDPEKSIQNFKQRLKLNTAEKTLTSDEWALLETVWQQLADTRNYCFRELFYNILKGIKTHFIFTNQKHTDVVMIKLNRCRLILLEPVLNTEQKYVKYRFIRTFEDQAIPSSCVKDTDFSGEPEISEFLCKPGLIDQLRDAVLLETNGDTFEDSETLARNVQNITYEVISGPRTINKKKGQVIATNIQ